MYSKCFISRGRILNFLLLSHLICWFFVCSTNLALRTPKQLTKLFRLSFSRYIQAIYVCSFIFFIYLLSMYRSSSSSFTFSFQGLTRKHSKWVVVNKYFFFFYVHASICCWLKSWLCFFFCFVLLLRFISSFTSNITISNTQKLWVWVFWFYHETKTRFL